MSKRWRDDTYKPDDDDNADHLYDNENADYSLFLPSENNMMHADALQWLRPDSDNLDFLRPISPPSLNPTNENNYASSQNEHDMPHEIDGIDGDHLGMFDENRVWNMIPDQENEVEADETSHMVSQNEPQSVGNMLHTADEIHEHHDLHDITPPIMAPTNDRVGPYVHPMHNM